MIKGKLKTDNRGMSLLEIIIAVTILGIITVPLLNLFVTSANLTFKAKKTGLNTTETTSIYEQIKATPIDTLLSDASTDNGKTKIASYFDVDQSDVSQTSGNKASAAAATDPMLNQEIKVQNIKQGGRSYTADISVVSASDSIDKVTSASNYTLQDLKDMNNSARTKQMSFDHIWIQPTTDIENPDVLAMAEVPDELKNIPVGTRDAKGERITKKTRKIYLTLDAEESAGITTVRPTITYVYDIEWKEDEYGTLKDKKTYATSTTEQKTLLDGSTISRRKWSRAGDSVGKSVFDIQLGSFTYKNPDGIHKFDIMLFYLPWYDGTERNMRDEITIDNPNNLEGDTFIIKENGDNNKPYSGLIWLLENHDADDEFAMNVHTNMGLKTGDGTDYTSSGKSSLTGGPFRMIRVYDYNEASSRYSSSEVLNNADPNYAVSTIIKQESMDHIYYMTVTVTDQQDPTRQKYTISGIKVK